MNQNYVIEQFEKKSFKESKNHGHTFNLEENVLNWSISGMFYNLWKNYSIII